MGNNNQAKRDGLNEPTGQGKVSPAVRGPLRVIINGIHAKSGGGITYLRNILPELAAMPDLELHLFLQKDQFELFYPVSENVHVTLFDFRPSFFRTLIWEQLMIPLLAWEMDADVVFSPANYGPVFARNHVILLRNAVSVINLTKRLRPVFYWLALSGATFVSLFTAKKAIAVSNYARKLMTFGFKNSLGKKIAVVYHGTHPGRHDQVRGEGSGEGLLAVSDIYIQKNYHTLINAHAILIKKTPGLQLFIVGREIDQIYAQSLRKLVEELGLEDNVCFKGHVETDELMTLYRDCRVFVFPSLIETFGNPLLEAMSTGAPIACSNEAAMPEVLGDTGVFFDPRDKFDMADKIAMLLGDEKLSKALGDKASIRARSFLWKNTAQQTLSVLRMAARPENNAPRRVR